MGSLAANHKKGVEIALHAFDIITSDHARSDGYSDQAAGTGSTFGAVEVEDGSALVVFEVSDFS